MFSFDHYHNYTLILVQRNIKDILHSYYLATFYDPTWYKAWHTWALANFEVVGFMESQNDYKTDDIPGAELAMHVVQAVDGVFAQGFFSLQLIRIICRILSLDCFEK